jgi:hypothetical protein
MLDETMYLKTKLQKMRLLLLFFLSAGFFSCSEDLIEELNEKTISLEQVESLFKEGYQINPIRDEANPSYRVNRFGQPNEYAVIRTKPKKLIEKNFNSEKPLTIEFVDAFSKLNCSYLYYSHEFKRMDFSNKNGLFGKKEKVILFKGEIPKHQRFVLKDTDIKELTNGWKYIVILK